MIQQTDLMRSAPVLLLYGGLLLLLVGLIWIVLDCRRLPPLSTARPEPDGWQATICAEWRVILEQYFNTNKLYAR